MRWIICSLLGICSLQGSYAIAGTDHTPGQGFEVLSYDLALTPDIENASVAGHEVIRLRTTEDGVRQFVFTGNALDITQATLDGAPLAPGIESGSLIFRLPKALRRGLTATLDLTYQGHPARGLVRSETGLYTSYFACEWMICLQDQFGDKARLALALRVPKGMKTLSVGRLVSIQSGPDGSEVHIWRSPRPYSAYLYGFAVGRFNRIDTQAGVSRLTYLSDSVDASILARRFAPTPDQVHFLSRKLGLSLPVPTYSQLLVEGSEAQEAATFSVLGIDVLPADPGAPVDDWAIVHELTHQWFGNLITCETLQDFWLNEGLTVFMTAAWKEHRYGRDAYEAEIAVARTRWEKASAKGLDRPLAWGGRYPSLGARRAIQYSKGAVFMDHLRSLLGEPAFWKGLRDYVRKNAGGTVTSIDLENAMEAASGRDLHASFKEWVFGEPDSKLSAAQ
ncbi:M1 family peptidase [Novosphingobium profundi]|uniref:M1 family metallopeptidase n=1 Tax=Novosphingobium profundi TaxID=1774954 RepID=UPI001BDA4944|nr:M1 family aminopeptidase [Novosphingobium profundi]MBT0668643.1 M1 family peptidase [Novosphingobium profundi]